MATKRNRSKRNKTKRKIIKRRVKRGGVEHLSNEEIKTLKNSMITPNEHIALFIKNEEAIEPSGEIRNDEKSDVIEKKMKEKQTREENIRFLAEKEKKSYEKEIELATSNPTLFMLLMEDNEPVEEYLSKYFKPESIQKVIDILKRFIST